MIENRRDLSAWVMHFVHNRNPKNNPAYEMNEGGETPLFPFHEDQDKNSRFALWEMVDESSTLAPDDDAFCVLLKIIEDGHIRSGWSFRDGKPTIYGPRSACCFTEMPLYALVDYAKRRSADSVGAYAIGVLRDELYAAGGRPAIYGLSGPHRELPNHGLAPPVLQRWPRKLDPICGLAEQEQYRYVSMNLGGKKRIDWAHEREWRWADVPDVCTCPGLPVWLQDEPHQFSRVMLVVPTQKEADRILDKLKELYDAGWHNFDYAYNKDTLAATHVVALETVAKSVSPDALQVIRLDDLPVSTIKVFSSPPVDEKYTKRVSDALAEAHGAAKNASNAFIKSASKSKDGHVLDVCGFARLVLYSPQHPLATALLELGEGTVIGGVGYWVSNFGSHTQGQQALSVREAAVEAAREVMQKHFPDASFGTDSTWD
ncbi:MAG TPA: hypothetical protein DCQ33_17320 [Nitrospira sp.]|nr:hypothetical protein [Nitrospira sp.]